MAFDKGIVTMAVVLGLLLAAATAPLARDNVPERYTYVCQFPQTKAGGGWISPAVLVEMQGGAVKVADLPLLQLKGQAVEGRIVVDNAARRTFAWEMKGVRSATRQYAPSLNYRMSVRKDDNSAMITMTPLGFGNIFQESGGCAVRAGGLAERAADIGNRNP